jgi:predicted AlkP superfamily phosphohydrolase/phosphomutase
LAFASKITDDIKWMALFAVQSLVFLGNDSGDWNLMRTKILVLGIDGANPDLLLRWAAEGVLPNIANLIARGQSGKMSGLDGFFIGSTWPSIYTGVTPASHGFHYLVQLKPGSYEYYRPADRGMFHSSTFWSVLSRAGRRVAILDAPLSPLDKSINGMQILEWGGHDEVYGFLTQPENLSHFIESRFGRHPVGTNCGAERQTAGDYVKFVEHLEQGVKTKAEISKHFLRKNGWDLFMQVFSEAHCVGHQCWHLHDTSHPAHDRVMSEEIGDPLQRVYEAIDVAIGDILEEAGECTVFLFSSHGMSHWYGAQFMLPEILARLGVSYRPDTPKQPLGLGALAFVAAKRSWHSLPPQVRQRLGGVRRIIGADPMALPTINADPDRSLCFDHRNGLAVGGIRLNLVGREPHGLLNPGAEADEFCRILIDDLLQIVDDDSGQPLIRRVLRVSDHYQGPHLAELPDLLVEYDDVNPVGSTGLGGGRNATIRARSPKIGVIEGTNSYGRSGEHRSEGLLIAAGPDIGTGAFLRPVSVLDLAPTWTRLLGVDLVTSEGNPIDGLGAAKADSSLPLATEGET